MGEENERSQNSGLQVLLREQKFADLVHHGAWLRYGFKVDLLEGFVWV